MATRDHSRASDSQEGGTLKRSSLVGEQPEEYLQLYKKVQDVLELMNLITVVAVARTNVKNRSGTHVYIRPRNGTEEETLQGGGGRGRGSSGDLGSCDAVLEVCSAQMLIWNRD